MSPNCACERSVLRGCLAPRAHRKSAPASRARRRRAAAQRRRYVPQLRSGTTLTALALMATMLSGCASAPSSDDTDLIAMLSGNAPRTNLSSNQLAEIEKHPLGSAENPVLSEGPPGERAYLIRLRRPEGRAPTFERNGSVGIGPYGAIMDVYNVACDAPAMHHIYMDMYHPGHVEKRAVSGFTIQDADGT